MKESFWGIFVIGLGITAITIVYIFQSITNSTEHNYHILKETTRAAMVDAFDLASYKQDGTIRIDGEKFVENFIRRLADNVSLSREYIVKIYDVNEEPPKVTVRIQSKQNASVEGKEYTFNIDDKNSAILETPY